MDLDGQPCLPICIPSFSTQHLLEQASTLNRTGPGRVQLVTTGEPAVLQSAARRWLGFATDDAVRWVT